MRKFTDAELGAMLRSMSVLAESIVERSESLYQWPEYNSDSDHAQTAINWADSGAPLRKRLQEATQCLSECTCFDQYGEDHVIAFLRRYAEIALKSFRLQ